MNVSRSPSSLMDRAYLNGFLVEAWRQLRRPFVPSLVAIVVTFAGTLSIFATTGQSMAGQFRTLERLNSPEGRLVVISDGSGSAKLRAPSVEAVAGLDYVEWVIGVSAATDVTNGVDRVGQVAPSRRIYGYWPPAIEIRSTRAPEPGDALIPEHLQAMLSMGEPIGSVQGRNDNAVVVGSFEAEAPLTLLNNEILISTASDRDAQLLHLYVSVTDVARLTEFTNVALDAVQAQAPESLTVRTSAGLEILTADITTELARQARWTLTGLLSAVLVLVAALQYGRITSLTRDIGRRRALGASRSLIVAQVLTNGLITGLLGSALGAATGLALIHTLVGGLPGMEFTLATIVLITLASVAAAILPGIRAARLDPVRILRVP